jgi:anti-anti-sigma factor
MHITVEPRDEYSILHLRGEFDTYYCPLLQQEVEALISAGVTRVALNLRLVRFINSTALGAIIKASKDLEKAGGKLAISRPSSFCKDIMEKIGLDRIVTIYDTDEAAGTGLLADAPGGSGKDAEGDLDDETVVMFTPVEPDRITHFLGDSAGTEIKNPRHRHTFGSNWNGVGRMSGVDVETVRFTWNGGNTGMTPFEMGQFLAIGTEFQVKFRLPLLKKGRFEAVVTISEIEERPEGVKVGAAFSELDDETRDAIAQYSQDLAYLKQELQDATGGEGE